MSVNAKYYWSGVVAQGNECHAVDDGAEFWSVYTRDEAGLSSCLCDCYTQKLAEDVTAMLNKQ